MRVGFLVLFLFFPRIPRSVPGTRSIGLEGPFLLDHSAPLRQPGLTGWRSVLRVSTLPPPVCLPQDHCFSVSRACYSHLRCVCSVDCGCAGPTRPSRASRVPLPYCCVLLLSKPPGTYEAEGTQGFREPSLNGGSLEGLQEEVFERTIHLVICRVKEPRRLCSH